MKLRIWVSLVVCACLPPLTWGQTQDLPEITGKGTANSIPRFTSRTTIGNSVLSQAPGGLVGVGTTTPGATLDIASNFPGGGPTAIVENVDPTGDIAIDFHSGGAFLGNIGVILSGGPPARFFIMENGAGLPLTLVENGGVVGIGTSNPTNILTIGQGAGHALADGWDTYSSRKLKDNIQSLEGALHKVEQLRGVYFDWKTTGKHDVGLIAEDVAQVIPEIVSFEPNGRDARSVDYSRLTALLVEAIKEQQSEISELKGQIEKLHQPVRSKQ